MYINKITSYLFCLCRKLHFSMVELWKKKSSCIFYNFFIKFFFFAFLHHSHVGECAVCKSHSEPYSTVHVVWKSVNNGFSIQTATSGGNKYSWWWLWQSWTFGSCTNRMRFFFFFFFLQKPFFGFAVLYTWKQYSENTATVKISP